jgi:hypothetical protein
MQVIGIRYFLQAPLTVGAASTADMRPRELAFLFFKGSINKPNYGYILTMIVCLLYGFVTKASL